MTATGQNFNMFQGDDKVLRVTVVDDAGNRVPLSGATIAYGMYRRTKENIVLSKSTASGINITVPGSGIFEVTLNRIDTLNLRGEYGHEAEMLDSLGNHSTLLTGVVVINRSLINV